MAQVRAVREAGGADYDIAIDVHGRWNTKSTIEIIRALEPFRLFFYEEAVPPENVAAMAEVQRVVNVPLATGERIFGRHGFRGIARAAGRADRSAGHCANGRRHGVQEDSGDGRRLLRPVAPHNPNGPICTIASMHARFSIPNFLILEFFEPDEAIFREIVVSGWKADKGSGLSCDRARAGRQHHRRFSAQTPFRREQDRRDGTPNIQHREIEEKL